MRKQLYFASIVVPEDISVKESGAAIVYVDGKGEEHTQQVAMFKLVGTSEELTVQLSEGVKAVLGIIDEQVQAKLEREEKSLIIH